MSHIDPKEPAPSQILNCPKSGQLLGAIVSAFRLDDPAVGGESACHLTSAKRPAKEYFAGKWTVDEKRTAVCEWVAKALLASGLLGDLEFPPDSERESVPVDLVLTGTMRAWLDNWDATFRVVATKWPKPDQALGGFVLGRQVVIDLALRWAAIYCLTHSNNPLDQDQPWCHRDGASRIIRSLVNQYLPGMSPDDRAAKVEVDPRTLGRWLSPTERLIPSEANVVSLSEAVGREADVPARCILARLRREYA